jgi:hypothetical protein
MAVTGINNDKGSPATMASPTAANASYEVQTINAINGQATNRETQDGDGDSQHAVFHRWKAIECGICSSPLHVAFGPECLAVFLA